MASSLTRTGLSKQQGDLMSIQNEDMQELRRLAANTYEQDKSNQIHRILQGITNLQNTIASLTRENKDLKNQLKELND